MLTREEENTAQAWGGQTWEYRARNLKKVPGIALEDDFNKFGQEGWEFVAVAEGYAVFKRSLEPSSNTKPV